MPNRKRRVRKPWRLFLFTFLFLLLCAVGYYTYSIYSFAGNISSTDNAAGPATFDPRYKGGEYKPPVWEGTERVNVLLLGADARGKEDKEPLRSDTLMIASIDPVTKKAALMSVLRDTWVKIPGNDEGKINSAFTIGGPNLAMKTVSELTGIPIQYYLYTDFQGFIALVDAVGGIDLEVEKDMKWKDSADGHVYDIDLKKGMQHLDGKTALQYVRFRHDATSDFSRTERQRKFLTAVADKMQSTESILKLPSILKKMQPYITTNLSLNDMIKLSSLGMDAKAGGIESIQIPPTELVIERRINDQQVIAFEKTRLKRYVQEVLNGTADSAGEGLGESGSNSGSDSSGSRSSGSTTRSGTDRDSADR
ncbi:LCP family protein [Paenibacillus lutrae]|uniref:LytR family transcriptional regulator n=1 Tax=Paenibacillus lutrae TaxID=2078573 RepID=A0A7X3FHT7_9BACL|nr:LCP family protein [Paenibacillus lutrae]MVO99748.1 LytR family transcriptional regulator [Paenibacillus lutrae]